MSDTKKYLDPSFQGASKAARELFAGKATVSTLGGGCGHDGTVGITIRHRKGELELAGSKATRVRDAVLGRTIVLNASGESIRDDRGNPYNRSLIYSRRKALVAAARPAVEEVIVQWPDFGLPPVAPEFWTAFLKIAKREYKRVVCCCVGGHGRTGTALACLLVAHGLDAERAIQTVRAEYCEKAVETAEQEQYVADLAAALDTKRRARKARKDRARRAKAHKCSRCHGTGKVRR